MKLVSVYINAYNAEKFILETVNSVLNQTYKNLQVIVVDDASTDKTPEILASIDDSRLEVYRVEPNGNISNALNVGLSHIKGEYVAHDDADDLWMPDKIEKQVEYLENNPQCDFCVTHVGMIDENGDNADEKYTQMRDIYNISGMSQAKMFRYFYDHANHICHCSMLARAELIKKVGKYDLSMLYLQDFDYWMRVLCFTPIHIIEEPLTLYRIHSGNNSRMNEAKWTSHDTEYARLMEKAINLLPADVFCEAFADKLKIKGEHTPEEIELEKAFVMIDAVLPLLPNNHIAINKFAELFKQEKYVNLAAEKFSFTIHDFYKLQTVPSLHNAKKAEQKEKEATQKIETLNQNVEQLEKNAEALNQKISELNNKEEYLNAEIKDKDKRLQQANGDIIRMNYEMSVLCQSLEEYNNSFFWRATAPARKAVQKFKNYLTRHPRILAIFIFIKCFLKHGYQQAKEKYIAFLPKNKGNSIFERTYKRKKAERKTVFEKTITISILVPLYNTPKKYLVEMVESVMSQTYSKWELCLADGSDEAHSYVGDVCCKLAKKDKRIKYKKLDKNKGISDNTNECIKISSGEYIALFDHDDLLHSSALYEVMQAICEKDADMVYTDEVTFEGDDITNIVNYAFKPDYAPDTLRSYNYICHFTVFSRELMEKSGGGFNNRFDGSQDYDMVLRLTENAKNIVHISKALYFWRSHAASTASSISAKPYIIESAHKALQEHLERQGLKGEIQDGIVPSIYKIKYEIDGEPKISIVIPNKDHTDDLNKCLNSIFYKSSYKNYEIIIIENNSTEEETFAYYEKIKHHEKVQVVYWKREFNYSAINNFGVQYAKGDYILLLNNDVEVINEDWLEEMLMFAQRSDVGAVGAKLYYPDDTVQHAGVIIGVGGVAGHSHKNLPRSGHGFMGRASIIQNLSACTAACLMIPRKVYEEVGGLEEGYAVAFNDVDFCMKIRDAGYLIVYTPYAELYHYESKSRGLEDTPQKVARFNTEINRFKSRWGKELEKGDPYYNPNLTLAREDFSLDIK